MKKLFDWLQQNNYQGWSHCWSEGNLKIGPIENFDEINFSSRAPCGTLYHYYKIDKNEIIKNATSSPQWQQFLNNLEKDLKEYH